MDTTDTAPTSLQTLQQEVRRQCADIDAQVIDEFFTQLDAEYFSLFTPSQIAVHLTLLAAVQDAHPVHVRIVSRTAHSAEI